MEKSQAVKITLPVDLTYLPAIQVFVGQLTQIAGLPPRETELLVLAVEEAITNVIQHAFMPDEAATFEIICEHSPVAFTVRVRDKGLPFDPDQVKDLAMTGDLEGVPGPGLGFRLMKRSVDRLAFHNLGHEGKEVMMTRFIHQRHIKEYLHSTKLKAYDVTPPASEEPKNCSPFEVRLLEPHQAIEVAQCAYRTYGYTYMMENVYFPERLIEMTRTGDLVSAVALCPATGDVMGHCALEFHGRRHGIPEMGMAFVKPEYRGRGCLNRLNDFFMRYAQEKGITGIYCNAVTTHTVSQKALDRIAFHPTGILVGHSPPKAFSRMKKSSDQRETLVLHHRKIGQSPPLRVYAPPSHRDMILRIFRRSQIGVESVAAGEVEHRHLAEGVGHMEVDMDQRLLTATITVLKYGKDFENAMHQRLRELCLNRMEAITIFLDLTDLFTPVAVPFLEKQDCFFAGVFPAYPRHFLIMQYLNNVPIDYTRVATYKPLAGELLPYIIKLDPNAG